MSHLGPIYNEHDARGDAFRKSLYADYDGDLRLRYDETDGRPKNSEYAWKADWGATAKANLKQLVENVWVGPALGAMLGAKILGVVPDIVKDAAEDGKLTLGEVAEVVVAAPVAVGMAGLVGGSTALLGLVAGLGAGVKDLSDAALSGALAGLSALSDVTLWSD